MTKHRCESCGCESNHGIIYAWTLAIGKLKSFMCERCMSNEAMFNPCKRLYLWFPGLKHQRLLTGYLIESPEEPA